MDITRILLTYVGDHYKGPPMATDEVMYKAASEIKVLRSTVKRLEAKIRTLEKDIRFYLNSDIEELSAWAEEARDALRCGRLTCDVVGLIDRYPGKDGE